MSGGRYGLVAAVLAVMVAGVRADNTLTALIVSSCIVGVLLLIAVLGFIIYCAVKMTRNSKDLQKSGPLSNGGMYRLAGPPSPATRAKAYTQHAAPPRHRPPLTFYTVRADPRDVGLATMGPGYMMRPPQIGRPVLYLDMLESVRPRENGTLPMNANGAAGELLIREMESGDDRTSGEERYRRKDKKSGKHRSRSKTRGGSGSEARERSRSRSRGETETGERDSLRKSHRSKYRYNDMEQTPILAMPGDIILAESGHASVPVTPAPLERRYSQHMVDPTGGFTTTALQEREYTMTFEREERDPEPPITGISYHLRSSSRTDMTQGDTFVTPSASYTADYPVPEPTPRAAHMPPTSLALAQHNARMESDSELSPRVDYLHPVSMDTEPRREPEPEPREDYSASRPTSFTETTVFNYREVREDYPSPASPEGRAGANNSFEALLNSVDFDRGPSQEYRPPTPPYDGELSPRSSVYSPRRSTHRQMNHDEYRAPSPPLDIPSPRDEDIDIEGAFAAALSARPPTPPPGKILPLEENHLDVLRDLQEESAKAKQRHLSGRADAPALPFMAELKRRQRDPDDDDDDVTKPPTPPLQRRESDRGDDDELRFSEFASPDPYGNGRGSHVSFAAAPPEIIPHDMPGSNTSIPPDYPTDTTSAAPPSPPPPPPPPPAPPLPPPPPPPPTSTRF